MVLEQSLPSTNSEHLSARSKVHTFCMVDHGACITGACDLYHLPIQSIWMPGFEVHTYCLADHWACITGAICRMLCNGWVQSPRPLEHSIQCGVYCTKEGPVGMSKAQKNIPMLTQRCVVSFCKIDIGLGSWLLYLSPPGQGWGIITYECTSNSCYLKALK